MAWWRVYGEGLVELEGRIYKGWAIIDEIPTRPGVSATRASSFGAAISGRWLEDMGA